LKNNVFVLFGINGVGKSTIARALAERVPDSAALSGSELLMRAFRGLDRYQLEILSPEEKMRLLVPAFLQAFEQHASARRIILDTHLVVPIRKSGRLVLENVWSDAFMPHVGSAFFVSSGPEEILRRRVRDYRATGRQRDADIDHIRRDQEINLRVFEETFASFASSSKTSVIMNEELRLDDTVRLIAGMIA